MEAEKQNKFLRLDVEVICKQDEFIRNLLLLVCIVILKDFYPLFIKLVWYTPYFVDFFFGFARIGIKLHIELTFLKRILVKMISLKSLSTSFKKFPDNIHVGKENLPILQIKRFLLVIQYLGRTSLQRRTKLRHSFRGISNCLKMEIVFKS